MLLAHEARQAGNSCLVDVLALSLDLNNPLNPPFPSATLLKGSAFSLGSYRPPTS